jgi:glycosyltransferase involved in cell wall biosynthesis
MRPLGIGAQGFQVAKLQEHLNQLGEQISVDGSFNKATEEAVQRFQQAHDLPVTGFLSAETLTALNASLKQALGTRQISLLNKNPERIVFRAPLNAYSGYGQHATQVVHDFLRWGYDVKFRAHVNEDFGTISALAKKCLVPLDTPQPDLWELVLFDPSVPVTPGKKTIFFTMWESTRLPLNWIDNLNQAECVVVPSQWCADVFSANGINSPIRVAQLGIYTDIFKYSPMDLEGPCVFGAAGRLAAGGSRKGIQEVISAFQQEFPNEPDARLKVKCFPDCNVSSVVDPRIEVTSQMMSWEEVARWFTTLTCFVSASRAEGFGLMQLQSLVTGRPIICPRYSGVTEYFEPEMGYPVSHKLVEATHHYTGCGHYAEPSISQIRNRMRQVYANRLDACQRGLKGATRCFHFSWARANRQLLEVLKEFGMVS